MANSRTSIKAAFIGNAAQNLFLQRYGVNKDPAMNIPSHLWNAQAQALLDDQSQGKVLSPADQQALQSAAHIQRLQQGVAVRDIGNFMGAGLLVGGGIGLLQRLPKLIQAKRDIDSSEGDEPDVLEPTPVHAVDDKSASYPQNSMEARFGEGVGTMALPLAVAGTGAAVAGGNQLVGWLTDKLRDKMVVQRKQKLRKEFEGILDQSINAPSVQPQAQALDKVANAYVKLADAGFESIKGVGTTLAALLAASAMAGGYAIGRKSDPLTSHKKALELMLKRRRMLAPVGVPEAAIMGDKGIDPEDIQTQAQESGGVPGAEFDLRKLGGLYKNAALQTAVAPPPAAQPAAVEPKGFNVFRYLRGAAPTEAATSTSAPGGIKGYIGDALWSRVQQDPHVAGAMQTVAELGKPEYKAMLAKFPLMQEQAQGVMNRVDALSKSVNPTEIATIKQQIADITSTIHEQLPQLKQTMSTVGGISSFMHNMGTGASEAWGKMKQYLGPAVNSLVQGGRQLFTGGPQQTPAEPSHTALANATALKSTPTAPTAPAVASAAPTVTAKPVYTEPNARESAQLQANTNAAQPVSIPGAPTAKV